jgi:hypothetical protein
MKYKIQVKTIQGRLLTFTVNEYTVDDGGFVCFTDKVTNKPKKFHGSNCEIEANYE